MGWVVNATAFRKHRPKNKCTTICTRRFQSIVLNTHAPRYIHTTFQKHRPKNKYTTLCTRRFQSIVINTYTTLHTHGVSKASPYKQIHHTMHTTFTKHSLKHTHHTKYTRRFERIVLKHIRHTIYTHDVSKASS